MLTVLDLAARDSRAADLRARAACDLVLSKRRANGRWTLGARHSGNTWFDMEAGGKPSRWNTLRALRATAEVEDAVV